MSKIERFMRHGNHHLLWDHLPKMKNVHHIALALGHYNESVTQMAAQRLAGMPPEKVAPVLDKIVAEVGQHTTGTDEEIDRVILNAGAPAVPHLVKLIEISNDRNSVYSAGLILKYMVEDMGMAQDVKPFAERLHAVLVSRDAKNDWGEGLHHPAAQKIAMTLAALGDKRALPFLKKEVAKERSSALHFMIRKRIRELEKK
jgi:hypothetical protein